MSQTTDRIITTRSGVQLRERSKRGPRGGSIKLYQAAEADPVWGYWYSTRIEAARLSNSSDRVIR